MKLPYTLFCFPKIRKTNKQKQQQEKTQILIRSSTSCFCHTLEACSPRNQTVHFFKCLIESDLWELLQILYTSQVYATLVKYYLVMSSLDKIAKLEGWGSEDSDFEKRLSLKNFWSNYMKTSLFFSPALYLIRGCKLFYKVSWQPVFSVARSMLAHHQN